MLLTGAGVVQELGSRGQPVRRRRQEKRASGLDVRVVDLRLERRLGDLRLRVKEDQLPLPPASLPPGLLLCKRSHLGGRREEKMLGPHV